MKALWTVFLLWFVASTPSEAAVEAIVQAGEYERRRTPVRVDVELSGSEARSFACVSTDGRTEPAQMERLPDGKARIWWIVDHLPAHQSKRYTIQIGHSVAQTNFQWRDGPGMSMDLLFGDRPVLRYMYTPFDANNIEYTKKPFHHVFDPRGRQLITKGVGGRYSHHRGIFFGYNRITVGDKRYDVWHAAKGEHQLHKKSLSTITGPIVGGHTLRIDWNDRGGSPFIEEIRRVRVFQQSEGELLVDVSSTLKTIRGPVRLDGDRQHAGLQFRAAQEVAEHPETTRYLRPEPWMHLPPEKEINTPEHKDLPWNAIQFTVGDQRYTVAYLADPGNPDGAEFSERLYGRFGEFFPYDLTEDRPLSVRYRLWVTDRTSVTRQEIEQRYEDLADPPSIKIKQ